jgi:hypothetical protein
MRSYCSDESLKEDCYVSRFPPVPSSAVICDIPHTILYYSKPQPESLVDCKPLESFVSLVGTTDGPTKATRRGLLETSTRPLPLEVPLMPRGSFWKRLATFRVCSIGSGTCQPIGIRLERCGKSCRISQTSAMRPEIDGSEAILRLSTTSFIRFRMGCTRSRTRERASSDSQSHYEPKTHSELKDCRRRIDGRLHQWVLIFWVISGWC